MQVYAIENMHIPERNVYRRLKEVGMYSFKIADKQFLYSSMYSKSFFSGSPWCFGL